MKRTGAQILVEALKLEGVDTLFCYPGGAVLNLADALYGSEIHQILVRHEQAAVHAADGYARSTGRVGVCLVTSGPGATNTVTGIATACMDSIPLVIFSGQVNTALIGNDAFQEADIVGITRPCTKHSYLVRDVKDMPRIIKEAFFIARTGRPGPVLVDIPKDVSAASCDFKYPEKVFVKGYQPNYHGHPGQIKKAMKLIASSKKPVLYTGGGIISSNAAKDLLGLAERLSIPVTSTLLGLGGFPGDHELFLGMLGMHGTYAANMAISTCDLIIAVGARFDDRATGKVDEFAPHAKIIHIDIDPTSISKNIKVDIPIVGDARNVLKRMVQIADEEKSSFDPYLRELREWLRQVEAWKADYPVGYTNDGTLKPQYVIERIFALTKGKAIIATEVGQNQMWTAQFYKFLKPRQILTSGGLGTMGYGFPAGHRGPGGLSRRPGHRHRGRRQHPDEHPGACHRGPVRPARQGGDTEQRLPRHGAPVAGAVLREALRHLEARVHAQFREACGGLRGSGIRGRARKRGGQGPEKGLCERKADAHRCPRQPRRDGLPHGPRGGLAAGHDARIGD